MKITCHYPIQSLQGTLTEGYYCRVLNGKNIIQRKPRRQSDRQRAMREQFGKRWGGKHDGHSPSATGLLRERTGL